MNHNGHSICFEWPFFVGSNSENHEVLDERMPHRILCVVSSSFAGTTVRAMHVVNRDRCNQLRWLLVKLI